MGGSNGKFSLKRALSHQAACNRLFFWVAAIAQWFRLRRPSCGPGSKPKHTIYAFSTCIEIVIDIGMRK